MDFRNQRIVITGGSRGIGLAVARELALQGSQLFLIGRDEERVRTACSNLPHSEKHHYWMAVDLADFENIPLVVNRAQKAMGGIDILVNNAAVSLQEFVVASDLAKIESEMRINYLGVYAMTRAVLPVMLTQKSGLIVNVASTIGRVPSPTEANYCASKAAVIAFSDALRSEVEDQGVKVKVFIPGHTETDMGNSIKLKTPQFMTVDEVARDFIKALKSRSQEYVCGGANRGIIAISRLLPETARKIMKNIALSSYYA